MQVKELMIREIETVSPDDSLLAATEKMKSLDLEPLPVCEDGTLVGMLTEEGVRESAARLGLSAGSHTVREVMSTDIAFCREGEDARQAFQTQQNNPAARNCRGMLVLDQKGALVGIVAVRALATEDDERPSVTGAVGASEPKVSFTSDPVDHMSEESFPASDSPAPPSNMGPANQG